MTSIGAVALLLTLAAAPEVTKVEPPGWWPGHSLDPVRVLLRGRNLRGARLAGAAGLRTSNVRINEAGTYLFADVAIERTAAPGTRTLQVTTSDGVAPAPFELWAPLPREGRFQGFSSEDLVYEIMPDRFADGDPGNDDPAKAKGLFDRARKRYYHGGDLKGIIDHLPYLKDLGITALWLTPVYDNNDRLNEKERPEGEAVTDYHGYGAVDFYAVDEHLGDLATLRELVDAAHGAGMKVIQDQVANHTGPYHPWVADPPTPTWFHGSAESHLDETWQTWTIADPHAPPELRRSTLDGWFVNILPDLNQEDPEAARYLIQNALWWIGTTGLDGIRQDTLPYVPRTFWREWSAALHREYPRLRIVGEMWDGDPGLVSFFQGGATRFDGVDSGIDALFDFPLFYPVRRAFAEGKPIKEVATMLARDQLYRDPAGLLTFAGNHDTPRFMNETGASADGLRLAFTFLLTARGLPMIYAGDEIGMPGGGDPDNRRDFPGGWAGDARNAFTEAGRTPAEQLIFERVRALARLRAELPALRRGRHVSLAVGDQIYAYARVAEGGAVIVVINNGTTPAELDVPAGPAGLAEGAMLVDRLKAAAPVTVQGGRIRMTLPARSASIYSDAR
ncbi:MAG: alpha-amylase [Acidobacteria bacterium]|nr:MAG: alpha-amylase [Acidobacteriota bacterium]